MGRFCNLIHTWLQQNMAPEQWTGFEATLSTPPADEPVADEAEGVQFMAFFGAVTGQQGVSA